MNGQREDDFAFLLSMLQSSDFQSLMRVHVAVTREHNANPQPIGDNVLPVLDDIGEMLEGRGDGETKELLDILSTPHVKVRPLGYGTVILVELLASEDCETEICRSLAYGL